MPIFGKLKRGEHRILRRLV